LADSRFGGIEWVPSPDLADGADWKAALSGVDVVVHLAARVHVMSRSDGRSAEEFRRVNVKGTLDLAEQAAGVRRFVFLSSIKIHGDAGALDEQSASAPLEPYGRSKWAAELALGNLASATGLEVATIRPPLVYGPGVKANFRALATAVRRGVPLPLGRIRNRRSLVGVRNLVDLIITCVEHPAAVSQSFLVSDGEDLSTPELVRRIAKALGRPARLLNVPVSWLQCAARLTGRRAAVERLAGSLSVDISKAQRLLGWQPPFAVDDELRRAVSQQ
jgi:nucleoside-diphosphate-sugar epimerase